jgi:outer membrane lipoprotein-sorting protein
MVVSFRRVILLGFFLATPAAFASPANDLVAKASAAYKAMNTFRAEGTIELTSQRGTQEGRFKIVGQGRTLTREEMTGISNYVTIGTETERWLYLPDRNQYHHLALGP